MSWCPIIQWEKNTLYIMLIRRPLFVTIATYWHWSWKSQKNIVVGSVITHNNAATQRNNHHMMESILVFKWVSQFSLTFGLLQDHIPDDFVRCIYCSFMQGAQIGRLSDGCKLLKSSRIPNISQSFQWLRHKILPSHKFAFTFKPFVVGKTFSYQICLKIP